MQSLRGFRTILRTRGHTLAKIQLQLSRWYGTARITLKACSFIPQSYPFGKIVDLVPDPSDLLIKQLDGLPGRTPQLEAALAGLRNHLDESVRKRVADVPRLRG